MKLKKFQSESKFRFIQQHALNNSPAKNVPSFKTGSERLIQPKLYLWVYLDCRLINFMIYLNSRPKSQPPSGLEPNLISQKNNS